MSSPMGEINAAEPVSEVAGTSLGAMATGATSKGIANKVQAWSVSLNVCSIAHHGDPDLRSQQVQENPEKLGICARKKRGFKAHSHAPNALPRHLISLSQIYEGGYQSCLGYSPSLPKSHSGRVSACEDKGTKILRLQLPTATPGTILSQRWPERHSLTPPLLIRKCSPRSIKQSYLESSNSCSY